MDKPISGAAYVHRLAASAMTQHNATAPARNMVQTYYDERVDGKLRDFTEPNPRIEAAIGHLAEWAPVRPKRILEIGCGVGASAWRMARAWPDAQVIGADFSPVSIQVANTCFRAPNLRYWNGIVEEGVFDGKFDLIILMDVYEHVAPQDRSILHAAIRSLLADDSRLILTVPTPEILARGRLYSPEHIQPVDEDIDIDVITTLASATETSLLYYRRVGIWNYGDFAHITLGRFQSLVPVALRELRPSRGRKQQVVEFLRGGWLRSGLNDYLGTDVLRPTQRDTRRRLSVSMSERRSLARAWSLSTCQKL
jgi:SAM-dependent methyltransferase